MAASKFLIMMNNGDFGGAKNHQREDSQISREFLLGKREDNVWQGSQHMPLAKLMMTDEEVESGASGGLRSEKHCGVFVCFSVSLMLI